jgi:hypothetical protein
MQHLTNVICTKLQIDWTCSFREEDQELHTAAMFSIESRLKTNPCRVFAQNKKQNLGL